MYLAVRADGRAVRTVEGLAEGEKLSPRPGGLHRKGRLPVRLLHAGLPHDDVGLPREEPGRRPLDEIKQALSGNLCRCGNYAKIYDAVDAAAKKLKGA